MKKGVVGAKKAGFGQHLGIFFLVKSEMTRLEVSAALNVICASAP